MAIEFDPADSAYVDCGQDDSILKIPNSLTVCYWARYDSVSGEVGGVENYAGSGGPNVWNLEVVHGSVNFYVYNAAGTRRSTSTGAIISAGQWYHIAGTYDGTDIRVYVDGSERDSEPLGGDIRYIATNHIFIGKYFSGAFEGIKDEVAIWNTVLTLDEIGTLAKSKRRLALSVRGDHLVGYWRLDGPNGAVAAGANSILDLSGNENHGTPYNDPVYRGSILTYPE